MGGLWCFGLGTVKVNSESLGKGSAEHLLIRGSEGVFEFVREVA